MTNEREWFRCRKCRKACDISADGPSFRYWSHCCDAVAERMNGNKKAPVRDVDALKAIEQLVRAANALRTMEGHWDASVPEIGFVFGEAAAHLESVALYWEPFVQPPLAPAPAA